LQATQKKIQKVVRPIRSPQRQCPPRRTKNQLFFQSGRAKNLSALCTYDGHSTAKVVKLILPNTAELNIIRGLRQISSSVSCSDSNGCHLAADDKALFITSTFCHLCERRYAGGFELFAVAMSSAKRPRDATFRNPKRRLSEGAKSRLQGN